MSLNKSTIHGSKPNFIQIHDEICEKKRAEIAVSYICDPSVKVKVIQTGWQAVQISHVCDHTKFERNWAMNV